MKLFLWLCLAVLVYLALRKNFRANMPPSNRNQDSANTSQGEWREDQFVQNPSAKQAESMLSCAHCQVYFPASESVQRGNLHYCCAEHADIASKTS